MVYFTRVRYKKGDSIFLETKPISDKEKALFVHEILNISVDLDDDWSITTFHGTKVSTLWHGKK